MRFGNFEGIKHYNAITRKEAWTNNKGEDVR
jgi:hypothetical protein